MPIRPQSANTLHASKADRDVVRRLAAYIRPHWKPMLGALALLPVSSGLHLLPPYLLKIAIDEAIVPKKLALLPGISAMLVGVLLAEHLASFLYLFLLQICGQRAMHDLRCHAHAHILRLSTEFFDRTPLGTLITRMTSDVDSIAEAFAGGVLALLGDLFRLLGIVGMMLWLDLRLAILSFAVLPFLLLIVAIFRKLLRDTFRLIRRRLGEINGALQEQIGGMKIVQVFGLEHKAEEEFSAVNRSFRDTYKRSIAYDALLFALVELLGTLTVALLLWVGGVKVVSETLTFGLLVAFVEYVQRFFEPIRDISAKYTMMQQAMASAERVFGLIDYDGYDAPPVTRDDQQSAARDPAVVGKVTQAKQAAAGLLSGDTGPETHDRAQPALAFREVSFAYHASPPLFSGFSLEVAPGEVVALVGTTGSGKSTIARLMIRLYEIHSGVIEVGGVDIRMLPKDEVRRRIVVLGQDAHLFSGSVRDNISLGDPRISDVSLQNAAERVGLFDVMDLDQDVGERGSKLSTGERQVIMMARAFARDPEILVLDEATSSVDPESERRIQRATAELIRDRTVMIIAHRLSTTQNADRVLVLKAGEIVEEGSHAELSTRHGLYAELYQLQYVSGT